MGEMVDLGRYADTFDSATKLTAYRAVPPGQGPWPGVVVIHEAFGLDPVMKTATDRMASLGYLALAPDLFARGSARSCLVATFRALTTGRGVAFNDLAAAREALVEDPACTGTVGVIGFCLGGGFALVLAGNGGYAASAPNYGLPPRELDAAFENACPIVASYGGKDLSLRGVAAKLDAALDRQGVPHDVKEYPEAGHSFLNAEDNSPWWTRPVTRLILRAGPQREAADDTWQRIDTFFDEHLGRGKAAVTSS